MNVKSYSSRIWVSLIISFFFFTLTVAQTNSVLIDSGPDTLIVGQETEYHSFFQTSDQINIIEWNWRIEATVDSGSYLVKSFDSLPGEYESTLTFTLDSIQYWNAGYYGCSGSPSSSRYNGFIIVNATDNNGFVHSAVKRIKIHKNSALNKSQLTACMTDGIYLSSAPDVLQLGNSYDFTGLFDDADGSGTYMDHWSWSVKLFHSDGLYTISSDTSNGDKQCPIDINIEQLPDDIHWLFIESDKILGYMQLSGTDSDGAYHTTSYEILFTSTITNISNNNKETNLPQAIGLLQNYPNPFNPVTKIEFELNKIADVQLSVFDIQGKLISKLLNETKSAGKHSIVFDAGNLAAGVYFYQFKTNNYIQNKKMLLIK